MSVSTFSSDFVHTALIQMGANQIKVVSGKQMVITFDLGNGLDLVYVLSVSNENKCFLQRARPPHGPRQVRQHRGDPALH